MYRIVYAVIKNEKGDNIPADQLVYQTTSIVADDYDDLFKKRIELMKNNSEPRYYKIVEEI